MTERRQPRARTDRAENKPGAAIAGILGNRLAGQFAGPAIEIECLVGDAELPERNRRAAKAVCRDRVGAGAQIRQMDFANEVGPALAQNLGAVLVPMEIALDLQVATLHLRANRTV